jgi:hypothetical protein
MMETATYLTALYSQAQETFNSSQEVCNHKLTVSNAKAFKAEALKQIQSWRDFQPHPLPITEAAGADADSDVFLEPKYNLN